MADNGKPNGVAKRAILPAERIVALRLWLHRRIDRLFDEIGAPEFTGNVEISLAVKNGRPGEPWVSVKRYGVTDL